MTIATTTMKDAALAVALMDLTSLNTSDTTKSIQALVDSINPDAGHACRSMCL